MYRILFSSLLLWQVYECAHTQTHTHRRASANIGCVHLNHEQKDSKSTTTASAHHSSIGYPLCECAFSLQMCVCVCSSTHTPSQPQRRDFRNVDFNGIFKQYQATTKTPATATSSAHTTAAIWAPIICSFANFANFSFCCCCCWRWCSANFHSANCQCTELVEPNQTKVSNRNSIATKCATKPASNERNTTEKHKKCSCWPSERVFILLNMIAKTMPCTYFILKSPIHWTARYHLHASRSGGCSDGWSGGQGTQHFSADRLAWLLEQKW